MVQIKRMADYERDVRDEAVEVFVDGYYKELSFFSKDRNKLKAAFRDLFCPDVFYVAEIQGEIVGILACANNKQRAMPANKASLRSGLGYVMGSLDRLHLVGQKN